jgi:hypothetical protein
MSTKNMIRIITLSMGLLAAVPVMGFAQSPETAARPSRVDARWTPYLGCWRLSQENVRSSRVPMSDVMMVCVAPSAATGGVTMTTYAAGKPVLTQNIVADGQSHPVSEADCQGVQTSEWSRDGERLFTHVDVTCNGRPARTVSGVTVMTKGSTWIDVQATEIDGDSQVRIRRYQRTIERPADVAELPADVTARAMADALAVSAATMNLEDVVEASKKISPAALEATLDETNARFDLNSRALKQLADAGVSPGVIDLMVAQSFPSEFHVDRRPTFAPPAPYSGSIGGTMGGIYNGAPSMGYPYYDPYYSYYSYYSPFAYPYWGLGYNYYSNYYSNYYGGRTYLGGLGGVPYGYGVPIGGGGGSVIVNPGDNTPGQVVNGRGYTRVSPGSPTTNAAGGDESSPASHTTTSPRGVRSSSPDSGSVSSSGYSSGSSSGSSNSGSSGGASAPSGGGGGDSGGRTAQPR